MHLGRAGPIKYGCFALDLHCLMVKNKDMGETAISLVEFNRRIGGLLHDASVQRCWVVAETSDVRQSGGHCYLELVQKDAQTGQTLARMRGIVWASVYARLRCEFERATGQPFASGLNVMVEVSANFHEQYGLSVVITGINPTYTLGDMARQRLEILNRLRSEGIIDMNKQLPWADVAQRVAVISAAGAAGYGDFMNQLHNNPSGIKFYTCLFPAVMQGQSTVTSVIAALERINDYADLFDCVVIIRGGGSTSDLNSFDNYDLAANVAQFPLPVICGIGHDRDNTVVDSVASVRVKTHFSSSMRSSMSISSITSSMSVLRSPAAEWLLDRAQSALDHVNALTDMVVDSATQMLSGARQQLAYFTSGIPLMADNIVVRHRARLQQIAAAIPVVAARRIDGAGKDLAFASQRVAMAARQCVANERQRVTGLEKQVELLSPDRVLRRGYSLTLRDGHVVTSASSLRAGDSLVTRFADGERTSVVE